MQALMKEFKAEGMERKALTQAEGILKEIYNQNASNGSVSGLLKVNMEDKEITFDQAQRIVEFLGKYAPSLRPEITDNITPINKPAAEEAPEQRAA